MTRRDVRELPAGRLLGVDLGTVRIGIALSDPEQTIATPHQTVDVDPEATVVDLAARIAGLARSLSASGVVVGHPRTLANREGRAGARARKVADQLAAHHDLPVALVDERFSTVEAARVMRDQGVDARAGRDDVDKVAAAVILQLALERRRTG
ncbi:MAG: Holliday junction resolvase RuvX [Nitriliruptorales bacterium]|nr:Holliday junction resolvase RuvX [Nitriliruptorales bacterium]